MPATIPDITVQLNHDYTYATIEDYEACAGFPVNEAFRMGWRMARTTNTMLGIPRESAAQEHGLDDAHEGQH